MMIKSLDTNLAILTMLQIFGILDITFFAVQHSYIIHPFYFWPVVFFVIIDIFYDSIL